MKNTLLTVAAITCAAIIAYGCSGPRPTPEDRCDPPSTPPACFKTQADKDAALEAARLGLNAAAECRTRICGTVSGTPQFNSPACQDARNNFVDWGLYRAGLEFVEVNPECKS